MSSVLAKSPLCFCNREMQLSRRATVGADGEAKLPRGTYVSLVPRSRVLFTIDTMKFGTISANDYFDE